MGKFKTKRRITVKRKTNLTKQLREEIRNLKMAVTYRDAEIKNLAYDKTRIKQDLENTAREKDRFYTESNQKTTRIARLENSVRCLKEAHQKTLLAFDTLA